MSNKIVMIAAVDNNDILGIDGKIPWKNKTDMKRFKDLTTDCVVIMGRKTFESIGQTLPNRINLVITRSYGCIDKFYDLKKAQGHNQPIRAFSLEDAIKYAKTVSAPNKNIWIIGGAEIYKQAMPLVDEIDLTQINEDYCTSTLGSTDIAYFPLIPHYFTETWKKLNQTDRNLTHFTYTVNKFKRLMWKWFQW